MSWFPLSKELLENTPEFSAMTPTCKLYYWLLISEYSLERGRFYRTDKKFGESLGVDEKTVQRARKTLEKCGFVEAVRGWRNPKTNRVRATEYRCVKEPGIEDLNLPGNKGSKKKGSKGFTQISREAFKCLLKDVCEGRIAHRHVVVYVYLWHLYRTGQGTTGENFPVPISEDRLRRLTRVESVASCVEKLSANCRSPEGVPLFEYEHRDSTFILRRFPRFPIPASSRELSM